MMPKEMIALDFLVPAFLVGFPENTLPMLRKITANRMLCAFDRIRVKPSAAYAAKTLAVTKPFVVPHDEELDCISLRVMKMLYMLCGISSVLTERET